MTPPPSPPPSRALRFKFVPQENDSNPPTIYTQENMLNCLNATVGASYPASFDCDVVKDDCYVTPIDTASGTPKFCASARRPAVFVMSVTLFPARRQCFSGAFR